MISLFLHIFYKAKTFKDKAKNQETLCQTITLSIRKLLKDWVAHKDVIGGSFFGASFFGASSALMYTRTSYLRLKDDELEVIIIHACHLDLDFLCFSFGSQCYLSLFQQMT